MGVALVEFDCFGNRFLSLFASYVLTTIVRIYLLNIIDSLSNYISINTYFSPISRVLRGEIYRYKR